ncbi:ribonuclease H-like domain-containing protein [Tanacetum coccineum]
MLFLMVNSQRLLTCINLQVLWILSILIICSVDTTYLLIYVDDIVFTASSTTLLQKNIFSLHKEFDMTDLGALNYLLGISVTRDTTRMFLSQKKYTMELLKRAHMLNCNPTRTLVDTESKLGPEGTPILDPTLYRSLAGGLHYLTFTRPDLSYAVQQICLYIHDPREPHLAALKRILLMLKAHWCLVYSYMHPQYLFLWLTLTLIGLCALLLADLHPPEYRGVANAIAETTWLRNLLREPHTPLLTATLVYCDNVSAVYLSANPVQHQRTKHIEIDIHFVHDLVSIGHVHVLHVPSRYQYADIFTKRLLSALFEEFHHSLSVWSPLAKTTSLRCFDCFPAQNAKKSVLLDRHTCIQIHTLYRSLAGALPYLTFTQLVPDISYAVQQVWSLYMPESSKAHHFSAHKRNLAVYSLYYPMNTAIFPTTTSSFGCLILMQIWAGVPTIRRSNTRK